MKTNRFILSKEESMVKSLLDDQMNLKEISTHLQIQIDAVQNVFESLRIKEEANTELMARITRDNNGPFYNVA